MKNSTRILKRSFALLDKDGAWTQGMEALDKEGDGIDPTDSRATSWCMIGALRKASKELDTSPRYQRQAMNEARARIREALVKTGGGDKVHERPDDAIIRFNDHRTTKQRLVLFVLQFALEKTA